MKADYFAKHSKYLVWDNIPHYSRRIVKNGKSHYFFPFRKPYKVYAYCVFQCKRFYNYDVRWGKGKGYNQMKAKKIALYLLLLLSLIGCNDRKATNANTITCSTTNNSLYAALGTPDGCK